MSTNMKEIDCPECNGQLTVWRGSWTRSPVHPPRDADGECPRWGSPRKLSQHEPDHEPGSLPVVVMCDDCGAEWDDVVELWKDVEVTP